MECAPVRQRSGFQTFQPRCKTTKDKEVFTEITLLDLKLRYEGTEAGKQYVKDIVDSQKGTPNPMKAVPSPAFLTVATCLWGNQQIGLKTW